MPQIIEKSGLSYFMTTKLGWNEYNVFPYDTFMWKGIDGSQVLTHLITTRNYLPGCSLKDMPNGSTTYNGLQNPSQIKGTWQRYQNKETSCDVLTLLRIWGRRRRSYRGNAGAEPQNGKRRCGCTLCTSDLCKRLLPYFGKQDGPKLSSFLERRIVSGIS